VFDSVLYLEGNDKNRTRLWYIKWWPKTRSLL